MSVELALTKKRRLTRIFEEYNAYVPLKIRLRVVETKTEPTNIDKVAKRFCLPKPYIQALYIFKDLVLKESKYNPYPKKYLTGCQILHLATVNELLMEWHRRALFNGFKVSPVELIERAKQLKQILNLKEFRITAAWYKLYNKNVQVHIFRHFERSSLNIITIFKDIRWKVSKHVFKEFMRKFRSSSADLNFTCNERFSNEVEFVPQVIDVDEESADEDPPNETIKSNAHLEPDKEQDGLMWSETISSQSNDDASETNGKEYDTKDDDKPELLDSIKEEVEEEFLWITTEPKHKKDCEDENHDIKQKTDRNNETSTKVLPILIDDSSDSSHRNDSHSQEDSDDDREMMIEIYKIINNRNDFNSDVVNGPSTSKNITTTSSKKAEESAPFEANVSQKDCSHAEVGQTNVVIKNYEQAMLYLLKLNQFALKMKDKEALEVITNLFLYFSMEET